MAGRVTEQRIGGTSFVRVDAPAVADRPAFTKILGASAINPVTEETARAAAQAFRHVPISEFEIPALRQGALSLEEGDPEAPDDERPF
jgi:hypothetical protein